jgi:hypothetical protein
MWMRNGVLIAIHHVEDKLDSRDMLACSNNSQDSVHNLKQVNNGYVQSDCLVNFLKNSFSLKLSVSSFWM